MSKPPSFSSSKVKKKIVLFLKKDKSLSKMQVFKELQLPPAARQAFKKAWEELRQEGFISSLDKPNQNKKKPCEDLLQGEIFLNPRGFGFVHPLSKEQKENIFIPKTFVRGAVNGDIVEVEVLKNVSSKGPEGRVVRIVERKLDKLVVCILKNVSPGRYLAHSLQLGPTHPLILQAKKGLKKGDRLYAEVIKWGNKENATQVKTLEFLGPINDASIDTLCSCLDHNIAQHFPSSISKELDKLPSRVGPKDIKGREDFRKLSTLTIDPDTAKDFDDAISIAKDNKGGFELHVHIADVSAYVKEGSEIDKEAKKRGNSTYFPDRCLPMLPFALSNELCSLKPRVNRLTQTVFMSFDAKGTLQSCRFYRSVIKSDKRFTYAEAYKVLQGEKSSPYLKELTWMKELCLLLKAQRRQRGSLEFSLPENKLYVDENGLPTKVIMIEYDITHQMIEEFMLKANEVVAKYLSEKGLPLPFRVHEAPKEESLVDFSSLSRAFGYALSESPSPEDLQALFDRLVQNPEASRLLSIAFIKSMKLACYATDNIGHYGLCLEHYCHFTSPIRRYSDLVVHRLLTTGQADEELDYQSIADTCSTTERQSAKAEMQVHRLKKLRLLDKLWSHSPHKTYSATITTVKGHGLSFETDALLFEGFLSLSQLEYDYFEYQKEKGCLYGTKTGISYHIGGKIELLLTGVDLVKMESSWALTQTLLPVKDKIKKKKKSKRKFCPPSNKRGKKGSKKKRMR